MPCTGRFKWGAATAGFHGRGGRDAGGKGPSVRNAAALPEIPGIE